MSKVWLEVVIVLVLLIVGGLFTATELALVSLRAGQLNALTERGGRGERVVKLAGQPTRYLGAVQLGSVLAGFFSAAFGAAALADPFARFLERAGVNDHTTADSIAVVVVTLVITYVALVVSELTPRRYAMQHAPGVAMLLGPLLDRLATVFRPAIWVLSKSTNGLLRVLRANPDASDEQISDEELRELVMTHQGLTQEERRIVTDVFGASSRRVREAMLPRTDVDFLDAALTVSDAAQLAWDRTHTRYPVIDGSPDQVVGFVHVRDLFDPAHAGRDLTLRDIVRSVIAFPSTKPMLAALTELQHAASQLAIVVDEYGGLAGIITVEDLVEELVGDIYDEYDVGAPPPVPAEQGRGEVDGLLGIAEFRERTGIAVPAGPDETVGGLVTTLLGRMPAVGDTVEIDGHRLSVVAVRGRRVHRLLVSRLDPPPPERTDP